MAGVWGKLNLKDQKEIVVINAPRSFEPDIKALDEDWSAKRFRRAECIKTMTRPTEWRFSKAGKTKK